MGKKLRVKNILLVAITAMFLMLGVYPAAAVDGLLNISILTQSPANDSWDGDGLVSFNCTANWVDNNMLTLLNITNMSLWGDFATAGTFAENMTNLTVLTNNVPYNFTLKNLPMRNYTWFCKINNLTSETNVTYLNWTAKVSTTPPSVRAFYGSWGVNLTEPDFNIRPLSVNITHYFWNLSNVNEVWYYLTSAENGNGQVSANFSILAGNISTRNISNGWGYFNVTLSLNFSSSYTSPGPHSIVFCVNDSASIASDRPAGLKTNCTSAISFIIKVVNITQLTDMVGNLAPITMNFTLENGTHYHGLNHESFNYTMRLNATGGLAFQVVGISFNETMMGQMNNTNMNTTATNIARDNIRNGIGGNLSELIWPDVSYMPTATFYKYGIIEVTPLPDNIYYYFNGTITNPIPYRLYPCTYHPNYTNYSAAIGTNGCWQNISSGVNPRSKIYLYIPRFSGGGSANDTKPPQITNMTFGLNASWSTFANATWLKTDFTFNITVTDQGGENATGVNASEVFYRWEALNSSYTNSSWIAMTNYTSTMWNATIKITHMADGIYNLHVNASDLSINNNTNTTWYVTVYIDDTNPVPASLTLLRASTIHTGDALTAADFTTCSCSDNSQTFGGTCSPGFDTSVMDTATTGSKSVECCRAVDNVGNTAKGTCSYTVYATTSGAAGAGGGGGAAGAGITGASTTIIGDIGAGKTTTVQIGSATPLKEAVIEAGTNKITNAQLAVSASTTLPSSASSAPSGTVYRYLDVKPSGAQFTDANIAKATLTFKVEKSWLTEKKINSDNIALSRFKDSKWTELTTSVSSEDSTYVYYKAESPGFSVFAITTRTAAAAPSGPTAPPAAPAAESVAEKIGALLGREAGAEKPMVGTYIAIIVIVALIGVAVYYFTGGKKKKKKKWA